MYDEKVAAATNPEGKIEGYEDLLAYVIGKIEYRAYKVLQPIIPFLVEKGISKFFLAGGALYKGPVNDLDLWPVKYHESQLVNLVEPDKDYKDFVYSETKIQICKSPVCYTALDLIEGFDFAHCKVAVKCALVNGKLSCDGAISPDFIAAMAAQTTYYCGLDTPQHGNALRALRRLPKVAVKLGLEQTEVVDISNRIVQTIQKEGLDKLVLTSIGGGERAANAQSTTDLPVGYPFS